MDRDTQKYLQHRDHCNLLAEAAPTEEMSLWFRRLADRFEREARLMDQSRAQVRESKELLEITSVLLGAPIAVRVPQLLPPSQPTPSQDRDKSNEGFDRQQTSPFACILRHSLGIYRFARPLPSKRTNLDLCSSVPAVDGHQVLA